LLPCEYQAEANGAVNIVIQIGQALKEVTWFGWDTCKLYSIGDALAYLGIKSVEQFTPGLWTGEFAPTPAGIGPPVKLTATTVYNSTRLERQWALRYIAIVNIGHEAHSVTATMLFFSVCEDITFVELTTAQLHLLPLKDWPSLKTMLDQVRAVGVTTLDDSGVVAHQLRKLLNLHSRNMNDCDAYHEFLRRNGTDYPHRYAPSWDNNTPILDERLMMEYEDKAAINVATETAMQIVRLPKHKTLKQWFHDRVIWASSGASSERYRLSSVKKTDDRLKQAARANKKTVAESWTDATLISWLCNYHWDRAKMSTKNEPGNKNRTLLAQYDPGQLMAIFASQGLETNMYHSGIVAEQTPKDTCDWLRLDYNAAESGVWTSADWSDFNWAHHAWLMARIHNTRAHIYTKYANNSTSKRSLIAKAYCEQRIAYLHMNRSINMKKAPIINDAIPIEYRSISGLWSGHRNTASDNCEIHEVYNRSIAAAWREVLYEDHFHKPGFNEFKCGDDEDKKHKTELRAALYILKYIASGHVLNSAKQVVGYERHEFLQRMAHGKLLVSKPLAAMCATFASGNWYKAGGHYHNEMIEAVSSTCDEVVTRGGHCATMAKVAVNYLNYYYKDLNGRNLEWWKFRNSNAERKHLIWEFAPEQTKIELPKIEIQPLVIYKDAPSHATQALINNNHRYISKSGSHVKSAMLQETYGSMYRTTLEKDRVLAVAEQWPTRENKRIAVPTEILTPTITRSELMKLIATEAVARNIPTLDTALYMKGMNRVIFNEAGGWEGLIKMGLIDALSFYENPVDLSYRVIPDKWLMLDPTILSRLYQIQ
jgi:hypothetical protein